MLNRLWFDHKSHNFVWYENFAGRITPAMRESIPKLVTSAIEQAGGIANLTDTELEARTIELAERIELAFLVFLGCRDLLPRGKLRDELLRSGRIEEATWPRIVAGQKDVEPAFELAVPPMPNDRPKKEATKRNVVVHGLLMWTAGDETHYRRCLEELGPAKQRLKTASGQDRARLEARIRRHEKRVEKMKLLRKARLKEAERVADKLYTGEHGSPSLKHVRVAFVHCAAAWEICGQAAVVPRSPPRYKRTQSKFEQWFNQFLGAVHAASFECPDPDTLNSWLAAERSSIAAIK